MTGRTITIRAALADDHRDLQAIMDDPDSWMGTLQVPLGPPEAWRKRLAEMPETARSLVACVEGNVVGSLGLVVMTRPRMKHCADLGMAVRAGWRGQGVGSALLKAAVDLCDNWLAVTRIELTVFTDNAPAIALYRKFGFEIEGTKRRQAFRAGVYVDAHLMARLKD